MVRARMKSAMSGHQSAGGVPLLPPVAGCEPSHSQRRGTQRRMLRSVGRLGAAKLHKTVAVVQSLSWGVSAATRHGRLALRPVLPRGKPVSANSASAAGPKVNQAHAERESGRRIPQNPRLALSFGQPSTDLPHAQERRPCAPSINSSEASSRRPAPGCTYDEASGSHCSQVTETREDLRSIRPHYHERVQPHPVHGQDR